MDPMTDEQAKVIRVLQCLIDNGGDALQATSDLNNALSMAYEFEDKTYFRYICGKTCEKVNLFENVAIKKLIYTMITANDWENLRLIIKTSSSMEKEVKFALSLALKLLELNQVDICKSVLKKSANRNIIFKNKETFLTFIIKNNYPVAVIIEMIKSGLFDVDEPNEYNETPMRLADERKLNIGEYFSSSRSDPGPHSQGHIMNDKQLHQLRKNSLSFGSCSLGGAVGNQTSNKSTNIFASVNTNDSAAKSINLFAPNNQSGNLFNTTKQNSLFPTNTTSPANQQSYLFGSRPVFSNTNENTAQQSSVQSGGLFSNTIFGNSNDNSSHMSFGEVATNNENQPGFGTNPSDSLFPTTSPSFRQRRM